MKKTDVIIVGAGVAGLSAALDVKAAGKSVLVLEKQDHPGGNGLRATSFPLADEHGAMHFCCMDDNYIYADDPRISPDRQTRTDANFKAAMEWSHWQTDARLIRALIEKNEETSDWVKSKIEEDAGDMFDDTFVPGLIGKFLLYACNKAGVEILCNTAAKKLLKDETGAFCAVLADTPEGEKEYPAGAVIVATGGFYGSPELLKKYMRNYDEKYYDQVRVGAGKYQPYTGDGVKMAFDAGGADDGTVSFEWAMGSSGLFFNSRATGEVLWVNKKGDRFGDESKVALRNSIYRQPDKEYYSIYDEGVIEYATTKPVDYYPLTPRYKSLYHAGKLFDDIEPQTQKALADGTACKSDTLEGIAEFIGCDAQVLKETVERYNELCEKGHDDDFCKGKEFLVPLKKPPFYVWKRQQSALVTHGPVKVNKHMALVDKNEDAIPGIYYAGVDIGGTETDAYSCCLAAHSVIWSVASGRIAADSAVKYL